MQIVSCQINKSLKKQATNLFPLNMRCFGANCALCYFLSGIRLVLWVVLGVVLGLVFRIIWGWMVLGVVLGAVREVVQGLVQGVVEEVILGVDTNFGIIIST